MLSSTSNPTNLSPLQAALGLKPATQMSVPQSAEPYREQFQQEHGNALKQLEALKTSAEEKIWKPLETELLKTVEFYHKAMAANKPTNDEKVLEKNRLVNQGAVDLVKKVAVAASQKAASAAAAAQAWQKKAPQVEEADSLLDQVYEIEPDKAQKAAELLNRLREEADAGRPAAAGSLLDGLLPKLKEMVTSKSSSSADGVTKTTTDAEGVTRKVTEGAASASYETSADYNATTGAAKIGAQAGASYVDKQIKVTGGPVTGTFTEGEISGSGAVGYFNDPATGAVTAGAKGQVKASVAEWNMDTPVGNVTGSFLKAEASATVGYDYDPATGVTFAGAKGNASASVFNEKIEGKYGKLEGQFLSAGVESKSGVEYDEKAGKLFVGTANKAEAKVAEVGAELKTADGSQRLYGTAAVLKAEASLDANMVVDKYGVDFSAKAGAEAYVVKGEIGAEQRFTPKALWDNTMGMLTDTKAPDFMDFGPVLGAKVGASAGSVGAGAEGGVRLGVDETNIRLGGELAAALGLEADVKIGVRLGPLKTVVDNADAIKAGAEKAYQTAGEAVDLAGKKVGEAADQAEKKVSEATDYAKQEAAKAAEFAQEKVDQAAQYAKQEAAKAAELARKKADQAAQYAQEEAAKAAEYAKRQITEAAEFAEKKASEAVEFAANTANQAYDAASNAASSAVDTVSETASNLAGAATDTWNSLWS